MSIKGNARWWEEGNPHAVARGVNQSLSLIAHFQEQRVRNACWFMRLYGSVATVTPFGITFSPLDTSTAKNDPSQLRVNATGSCVDTIQARIASRVKPRAWWLPKGSNSYHLNRVADQLTKFSDGLMLEQKVQRKGRLCARDSAIAGTGVAHVFMQDGRIRVERVMESNLWVDKQESLWGTPRSLHYTQPLDRGTAAAIWPDHKDDILKTGIVSADGKSTAQPSIAELILVVDSYRLADGPKNPGRHVITIEDTTLVDEKWPFEWFPFARLNYSEPQLGFFGRGLVENLESLQTQLNYVLIQIANAQRVCGTFKMCIEEDSTIAPDAMDGQLGPILPFRHTPPSWMTPPAVAPELYTERDRLLQLIYAQAGITEMQSSGRNDLGPNASGAAIRTVLQVNDDRFATLSEAYSDFHLEINRMAIELIKHAVESKEITDYEVRTIGGKRLQIVKWKDLDFAADMFELQAWPSSSLPIEPEGQLAEVNELVEGGWCDQKTGKQMLNRPDLEALQRRDGADETWIECCIERMTEEGEYVPPAKEDNLPLWISMLNKEIQSAKAGELEEEKIKLLRQAMDEAVALQGALAAPPPMAPGAGAPGAAAPLGVPVKPPTSSLLPMPTATPQPA